MEDRWTALTTYTEPGDDALDPAISPDSTKVAFSHRDHSLNHPSNLYEVAVSTGVITQLTTETINNAHSIEPSYNPGGTKLVFASRRPLGGGSANPSYNLWTYTFSGGAVAALTTDNTAGKDHRDPSYSSDGALVVHSSNQPVNGVTSASYNIWTIYSDGTNEVALTSNTAAGRDSRAPEFSIEDRFVAFQSTQPVNGTSSSSNNLWVLDRNTGASVPITRNTNANLDSSIMPGSSW
jgi:Tol biopolymer transport system component